MVDGTVPSDTGDAGTQVGHIDNFQEMTILQILKDEPSDLGWRGGGGARRVELRDRHQPHQERPTWWRHKPGQGEL